GRSQNRIISPTPEQARLASAFLAAPFAAPRPETVERFSVRLTANAESLPAVVLTHSRQTCELDLELAEPSASSLTSADVVSSNSLASAPVVGTPQTSTIVPS